MLRRGCEYNGPRILSPVTVERTRIDETPGMINHLYGRNAIARGREAPPAYLSTGFSLRGDKICHQQMGTFTSPQTFGTIASNVSCFRPTHRKLPYGPDRKSGYR